MTNKPVVYAHINHKLYQTDKDKVCSNCRADILITESKGLIISGDQEATKEAYCHECGQELLEIYKRVKPFWFKLKIGQKEMKVESIQTCSTPWCKQEFLIEWVKEFIEYERVEEWHVPVACPHCLEEHWINLYELHEK